MVDEQSASGPDTGPGQETGTADAAPEAKSSRFSQIDASTWVNRAILAVVLVVGAFIAYQIAAAYFPRWWAQRIGRQVNGGLSAGVLWGLFYGFTFSFIPVMVLAEIRRGFYNWAGRLVIVAVAIVLAIPNWLTLSIVAGSSSAAHAGQRIMDVDAPGFRNATLIGVIAGIILALALTAVLINLKHRRVQVRKLKAELKEHEHVEKEAEKARKSAAKRESRGRSEAQPSQPPPADNTDYLPPD